MGPKAKQLEGPFFIIYTMAKVTDYVKYLKDLTDIDITPGANEVKLFQNGNIIDTALYKLFFDVFNTYYESGYDRLEAIQNTINWIDIDITLKVPQINEWGYPSNFKTGKLLMLKPLTSEAREILQESKETGQYLLMEQHVH